MGTFYPFIDDPVELIGVEAGGRGVKSGEHAASLVAGSEGVFHGMRSYVLQDQYGQITHTQSISAGLDYPGVGPEHSYLKSIGRVRYTSIEDNNAISALQELSKMEGIIPALEPSHALAEVIRIAPKMSKDKSIVLTLSGRGDKDTGIVAKYVGEKIGD